MDNKVLHDIKDVPFNERETFNNAILLLSMVKSEYYYIVGFSRPENKIEIGFDIEDKVFGLFSETFIMDFSSISNCIKINCQLNNVLLEGKNVIPFQHQGFFTINNGYVHYERTFEKDCVIPVSIEKLNSIILLVKKDIFEFANQGVSYILSKRGKDNENNLKLL